MITDQEIDRLLKLRVPGGSQIRTWFIPAEGEKGTAVVRALVRQLLDAEHTRAIRFAKALVDIMDGIPDHDIPSETGFASKVCNEIARARADAKRLLQRN